MSKILITGGAGYIGSHAVKLFLEKRYEVVVFDNLSRGYEEAIETLKQFGHLEFVKGDLRNKEEIQKVFKEYAIEGVLHFAALCLVNESMEKPELYFENNVVGSLNLLEAMREAEVRKIVFSSTCATYGESEYLPIDEEHPQNPTNPYGESKKIIEQILRWYGEVHDFRYTVLRYFNVCGADREGVIGDSKKPSQLLVQNAVRGAMGIEPFFLTCSEVDTPDKTPIRDYIDVEDLVKVHMLSYNYLTRGGKGEVFNLGNGKGWSVKEIVSKVEEVFDVDIKAEKGEKRKGEYAKVYADISKVKRVLSWEPEKSLEESIMSLKRWYEAHSDGWIK